MSERNIFEIASRKRVRFPSMSGDLTLEQVWDLPLLAKAGVDLEHVARQASGLLKAESEESFVSAAAAPATSPEKELAALRLDLVKHIIATKQAENKARKDAADRAAERAKLVNLLANKQEAELQELTPEQIKERIATLDAAKAA